MQPYKSTLLTAYSSQLLETTLEDLTCYGEIPQWLSGSLISNGPAQFEVGETSFQHWFDGFAMLKKFTFQHGRVSFKNRFIHSQQYIKSNADQRLYQNEFGTYANASWSGRILKRLQLMAQNRA